MLLVTLPWARMVPPPEILEAFCRVYSSNEGGNGANGNEGSGPNATVTQTAVIPWPQPPGPQTDGTGVPATGANSEYFTKYPERGGGVADGKLVTQSLASRDQLRVPGGAYGEQMKEVVPKHATIHRITIPEDFSKGKQAYPRQLLLSPSSSPLREKFPREEEQIASSQPLPVFVQDDDQYSQQPKRNSRSFVFSSGGGIQPMGYNSSSNNKRASLVSLSTISEVGDDGGLGNSRSVYRNSVWHPRNSVLGVIRSPLSFDPNGTEVEESKVHPTLHHTSWESTHSSTHSGLTSTASSDSISLPPHLIPIAPPKSAPLPPATPTSAKIVADSNKDDQMTIVPLQDINQSNNGTSSLFDSQGSQPKVRQSSTCSVRSHWSDDSDHAGLNNKNHRFVGTLRGRREGSKSSTRADSLEWD